MATLDARNFPDGVLTTAAIAAPGVSQNVVDTGRGYSALVIDVNQAGGGTATAAIEHRRASDGVWCVIGTPSSLAAATPAVSVSIQYPVGQYRVNVTAVATGTVLAGYSCATPIRG